jgi:Domain of unknown function (DUF4272)
LLASSLITCVANNFPLSKAEEWLDANQLRDALSPFEAESLFRNVKPLLFFYTVNCVWSLAWMLNIGPELTPGKVAPDSLGPNFPIVNPDVTVGSIFEMASLRPVDELLQMRDICYCVQAALVEQNKTGKAPNNVGVKWMWVEHHRSAIEWMFRDEPWDSLMCGWRTRMPGQ